MSKNVIVNGTTYNGISSVKLPLAAGSGFAEFVENAGGGGSAQVATGSITPTQDMDYIDIENLAFTPKALAVALDASVLANDAELTAAIWCIMNIGVSYRSNAGGSISYGGVQQITIDGGVKNKYDFTTLNLSETLSVTAANNIQRTANSFRVTHGANSGYPFKANHKYNWIAIGW